jgi:uncharacterized protein
MEIRKRYRFKRTVINALIALLIAMTSVTCDMPTKTTKPKKKLTQIRNQKKLADLIKKAKAGNTQAQVQLSSVYEDGILVEKSLEKSFFWMLKAAKQGDVNAQSNVGMFYAAGMGVKQNAEEGIKWLKKAADAGEKDAMYNLGFIFGHGMGGIPVDLEKSRKWLKMAAAKGDKYAQKELRQMKSEE